MITFFNPAHLMRKLQTKGFDIEPVGGYHFTASRSFAEAQATVNGWAYFMRLVSEHLLSEDAVLGIVDQWVNGIREEKMPGHREVELDVVIRSM